MGVHLIIESPESGSPYDQWKIRRASSKTGTYSVIATRDLTDRTYYDTNGSATTWYKVSYYDSSNANESDVSTEFKVYSNTYTTTKMVAEALQISEFTDTSTPTIATVSKYISRAERYIDKKTHHSWRNTYAYDSGDDNSYEFHSPRFRYITNMGVPIRLKHRRIKSFSSADGDAIDIWNGNTWEDWLSGKTEGRNNDYWVDYEDGLIYFRTMAYSKLWYPRNKAVRLRYRYGESTVPEDVEEAATLLAAISLLGGEDRSVLLPEGTSNISYDKKIDMWRDRVQELIELNADWVLISSVP